MSILTTAHQTLKNCFLTASFENTIQSKIKITDTARKLSSIALPENPLI